ncbi:MAG TPA: hypothetical protein PKG67_11665, partial [Turneriella sp.]|nr:hypothetical protein [Turneriella sp.]
MMLRRSAALLSLCSIILLGDSAFAQQNLFNVPNGEITKPGHFFTQQQFNLTRSALQSNSTLDYGLGDGWEAGLNLFFLNFSNASPTEILTNVSEDLLPAEPL